ncbi:MAG: anthranilate phosphoribosyltransferase [Burkholderiaceae bacterium]|nr:MAG: anthranilate phosphoribosyltransferase [Burkholderiaceae bacterium]
MNPQQALAQLIDGKELVHDDMLALMRRIMGGEVAPPLIAGLLIALRLKKETVGEVAAAAQVMRELAAKVNVVDRTHLVDIVGTGGDASHTFNISTTCMFVAAGAGARVAKHGGRSVSSKSGAADVLEALGVNIMLSPAQVAESLQQVGIGFMFAPNHHSAMKYAAPVRRELGVRTMFNILGPLTNPAGATRQLLGVYAPELVGLMVRVLQKLGSEHVLVVHGKNGMDEISPAGPTLVGELRSGEVHEYEIHPEQFGFPLHDLTSLKVADADESKEVVLTVLHGEMGAARDTVLLNAGAALYVAGVADSIADGIERARHSIDSGAAKITLDSLVRFTQSCEPPPQQ